MSIVTVGVDISKLKFDVFYEEKNSKKVSKSFKNNHEGFKALSEELSGKEICLAMEATGNYGYALAEYMYKQGSKVHVINPALIKYYGKSLNYRIKTDKQDAKLINSFLVANMDKLHAWKPLSENHKNLKALSRCLRNLKDEVVRFGNAVESEPSQQVRKVYEGILEKLNSDIKTIELQIREIINIDAELKNTFSLLLSIPGIGELTAWTLISELPDIREFKNAKQIAAYAGLNPGIKQSGTSVNGRGSISKIGSAQLRKALYFPAMVALRFNPCIKNLGDRLKAKGKKGKVIIVAAMHKLLRIIFAILNTGKEFNPAINKA